MKKYLEIKSEKEGKVRYNIYDVSNYFDKNGKLSYNKIYDFGKDKFFDSSLVGLLERYDFDNMDLTKEIDRGDVEEYLSGLFLDSDDDIIAILLKQVKDGIQNKDEKVLKSLNLLALEEKLNKIKNGLNNKDLMDKIIEEIDSTISIDIAYLANSVINTGIITDKVQKEIDALKETLQGLVGYSLLVLDKEGKLKENIDLKNTPNHINDDIDGLSEKGCLYKYDGSLGDTLCRYGFYLPEYEQDDINNTLEECDTANLLVAIDEYYYFASDDLIKDLNNNEIVENMLTREGFTNEKIKNYLLDSGIKKEISTIGNVKLNDEEKDIIKSTNAWKEASFSDKEPLEDALNIHQKFKKATVADLLSKIEQEKNSKKR